MLGTGFSFEGREATKLAATIDSFLNNREALIESLKMEGNLDESDQEMRASCSKEDTVRTAENQTLTNPVNRHI